MDDKNIQKLIERHEGRVNHVYSDSLKIPTLGIGHALHVGSSVSDEIVDLFFAADFKSACDDCRLVLGRVSRGRGVEERHPGEDLIL